MSYQYVATFDVYDDLGSFGGRESLLVSADSIGQVARFLELNLTLLFGEDFRADVVSIVRRPPACLLRRMGRAANADSGGVVH